MSPVDVVWLVAIKWHILDSEQKQNFEDDCNKNQTGCYDVQPITVGRRLVKKASKLIRRNILACSVC